MPQTLRIGSRGSTLALWQAHHVRDRLLAVHPGLSAEVIVVRTEADQRLDQPLTRFAAKGVFVKELEAALEAREIDIAVHSLKDVPTELPEGLRIGAILEREDPRDCLISPGDHGLEDLPEGTVVGTSSPRRVSQLLSARPDLLTRPIRGNLETRLRKLREGQYGALMLALAGFKRIAPEGAKPVPLSESQVLPAPGQGALAVELMAGALHLLELLAPIHHLPTARCVEAERSLLAGLGGGCQLPVGSFATAGKGGRLTLRGVVGDTSGRRLLRAQGTGNDPGPLGLKVAERLKFLGAEQLLG